MAVKGGGGRRTFEGGVLAGHYTVPTNGNNPLCGDRLTFPSQDPPPKQLSRLNHIELFDATMVFYHKMEIMH